MPLSLYLKSNLQQTKVILRNSLEEISNNDEHEVPSKVIGIIFLGLCMLYILYSFSTKYFDRLLIARDYTSGTGWIVSYFDRHNSDAGSGRTIKYEYVVAGKTYSRSVYTQALFPECDADELNEACAGKRFCILFSTSDPSKSLINFDFEIVGDSIPPMPVSIDDFE